MAIQLYKSYSTLLLRPYYNLRGFGAAVLMVFALALSVLFLFFNQTYERLFIQELRGLYPPLFWVGTETEKVSPKLQPHMDVKEEVFDKRVELELRIGESDIPIHIWTGLRGIDFLDPSTASTLKSKIKEPKEDPSQVWMSSRLFRLLFAGEPIEKFEPDMHWIYLRGTFGGYKKIKIAGVFQLLNKERWMVLPLRVIKSLRLSRYSTRVITVYGADEEDDFAYLSSILPKRFLYRWYDRLPFFYDCFWQIVRGGIAFLGLSIGIILFFYLLNLVQMSYIEIKTSLFMIRIAGTPKFQFMLWANGLYFFSISFLIACSIFLASVPVWIVNSVPYHLTLLAYKAFLVKQSNQIFCHSGAWVLTGTILLFPGLLLAFALFRRNPARILGARL